MKKKDKKNVLVLSPFVTLGPLSWTELCYCDLLCVSGTKISLCNEFLRTAHVVSTFSAVIVSYISVSRRRMSLFEKIVYDIAR